MTTDAPGDSLEFVDGQGLVEITKEPKSAANELRIDENEVPDATGPPASGEALCTFTRSTLLSCEYLEIGKAISSPLRFSSLPQRYLISSTQWFDETS